ncbi:hypothetical protein GCM10025792_33510 [Pseudonocardia tropica]
MQRALGVAEEHRAEPVGAGPDRGTERPGDPVDGEHVEGPALDERGEADGVEQRPAAFGHLLAGRSRGVRRPRPDEAVQVGRGRGVALQDAGEPGEDLGDGLVSRPLSGRTWWSTLTSAGVATSSRLSRGSAARRCRAVRPGPGDERPPRLQVGAQPSGSCHGPTLGRPHPGSPGTATIELRTADGPAVEPVLTPGFDGRTRRCPGRLNCR